MSALVGPMLMVRLLFASNNLLNNKNMLILFRNPLGSKQYRQTMEGNGQKSRKTLAKAEKEGKCWRQKYRQEQTKYRFNQTETDKLSGDKSIDKNQRKAAKQVKNEGKSKQNEGKIRRKQVQFTCFSLLLRSFLPSKFT